MLEISHLIFGGCVFSGSDHLKFHSKEVISFCIASARIPVDLVSIRTP